MKFNINISLWAIIVLIGIVLALIYANRSSLRDHRATISALDSTSTAYREYRLKNDVRVSEQAATILSYRDAINTGLIEINKLKELNIKKVDVNVRLTERISVLEAEAQYDKPPQIVYVDTSFGGKDTSLRYVQIPFSFGYYDKWAELHAVVDDIPVFDTIVMWSYPEITLGWQRQGFLKKKERKVFYTNQNPYVHITDMRNVVIEEQKKWWQTDVAKVLGGIIAFEILKNLIIGK